MKKIFKIVAVLSLIIFSSCNNLLNNSLQGKKLYSTYVKNVSIYGVTVPYYVEELKFDFITDGEVNIIPTVIYGVSASDAELYNKKLKFNYTFKDGNLTISQLNTPTVKLTENSDFYLTSDGETYYKQSILELSIQQQKDRLTKELHTEGLDEKLFSKKTVF
jgi:hypothetical protein